MNRVEVTWIGAHRFVGDDGGAHGVLLSSRSDIGVRPIDAFLMALASCIAYDIVTIIGKQRGELQRLTITVAGTQDERPPRAFRRIELGFVAVAAGLRIEQYQRAVDLAIRYCPIRASLAADVEVTWEAVLAPTTPDGLTQAE